MDYSIYISYEDLTELLGISYNYLKYANDKFKGKENTTVVDKVLIDIVKTIQFIEDTLDSFEDCELNVAKEISLDLLFYTTIRHMLIREITIITKDYESTVIIEKRKKLEKELNTLEYLFKQFREDRK